MFVILIVFGCLTIIVVILSAIMYHSSMKQQAFMKEQKHIDDSVALVRSKGY